MKRFIILFFCLVLVCQYSRAEEEWFDEENPIHWDDPFPDHEFPDSPTPTPEDDPVPPTPEDDPFPDHEFPESPTPTPEDDPVPPTPEDDPVPPTPTPEDTPVPPTPTPEDTPVPQKPRKVPTFPGGSTSVGSVFIATDGQYYQVTAAGEAAFFKMGEPTPNLVIPNTAEKDGVTYRVTSIVKEALRGNMTLKSVQIGKNVKVIGQAAFYGCGNMTKIVLGKQVESIGPGAIQKCKKLTSITIPKNVTTIGKNAFYGDKKLKKMVVETKHLTPRSIGKNAFKGLYKTIKVTIPASKKYIYDSYFWGKGLSEDAKFKLKN